MALDSLTIQTGTDNKDGVEYRDFYFLSYYHINVFFCVARTSYDEVYVYELAKKKIKHNGETVNILCRGLKPTKSPLIIKEDNCAHKTRFKMKTLPDKRLELYIDSSLPIYHKAIKEGVIFPITGIFYVLPLEEEAKNGILNYYWSINKIKNIS